MATAYLPDHSTTGHFMLVRTSEGLHSCSCSDQAQPCSQTRAQDAILWSLETLQAEKQHHVSNKLSFISSPSGSTQLTKTPGPSPQSCPWSHRHSFQSSACSGQGCPFLWPQGHGKPIFSSHPSWSLWTAALPSFILKWSLTWHHLQTWRTWSPQVTDRHTAQDKPQGTLFGIPQGTTLQSDMTQWPSHPSPTTQPVMYQSCGAPTPTLTPAWLQGHCWRVLEALLKSACYIPFFTSSNPTILSQNIMRWMKHYSLCQSVLITPNQLLLPHVVRHKVQEDTWHDFVWYLSKTGQAAFPQTVFWLFFSCQRPSSMWQ